MREPDANKLNVDIQAERALEEVGFRPCGVVCPGIHVVRERNLFGVPRRKQSHFVDHTRQGTRGIGAPAKTEYADAISDVVYNESSGNTDTHASEMSKKPHNTP
jgi:hypothetical protein